MRRLLAIASFVAATGCGPDDPVGMQLAVNEIGATGDDFVEFVNVGPTPLDISGYGATHSRNDGLPRLSRTIRFPPGTIVPPRGFAVVLFESDCPAETRAYVCVRGNDEGGWRQLRNVSSSVQFLSVNALQFADAGALRSGTAASIDDHCVASCADWYGNARPIFWRGRVFALLGYELVEGALAEGRVTERRRVDFIRTLYGSDSDRSGNVFNNL